MLLLLHASLHLFPPISQVLACNSSSGADSSASVVPESLLGINGSLTASSVLRPFIVEAAGQSGVPLSEVTLLVQRGAALAATSPAAPFGMGSGAAAATPPLAILIGAVLGGLVVLVLLLVLVVFLRARHLAPRKTPLTSSPEHSYDEPQSVGDLSIDGVNPLVSMRLGALESAAGSGRRTPLRMASNTSEGRGVPARAELPLPASVGDPRCANSKWVIGDPLHRRAYG